MIRAKKTSSFPPRYLQPYVLMTAFQQLKPGFHPSNSAGAAGIGGVPGVGVPGAIPGVGVLPGTVPGVGGVPGAGGELTCLA